MRFLSCLALIKSKKDHSELIPPCDTRREKVGALYSTVSDLLAAISRAYPQYLSPEPRNIYPGSSVVIVVLNKEIHSTEPFLSKRRVAW